jgi:Reverse transcriptase (RNA-dependent DNA polymerase)
LKLAHVTPLLKKSCPPDSLSSYRPISSLPFVAKLLERVVATQLIRHIEGNGLYSPVQSAYRSHHSTETALLKIVNDVLLAVDRGDAVLLALFDLSAAFDTVDHTVLISRLSSRFGLSGGVLQWFRSYLSDRHQCVRVSGISSSPLLIETGVPQGSILGPLLFILYTTPLHDISVRFPAISDHYYADDTQLLTTFRPSADVADQKRALTNDLSLCASELKTWLLENRMKLNESKTDVLMVHSSRSRLAPPALPLAVGNEQICPVSSVRNLGFILDCHMTFEDQIRSTRQRCYLHLRRIARLKQFLSYSATTKLITGLVFPILDYGNSLLAGLPEKSISQLQLLQNSASKTQRLV